MDDPLTLRIEYIEARRVLLDALSALRRSWMPSC